MAVGNLLLAALSFWETGEIPGIYDPAIAVRASAKAWVTADLLNVRGSPGEDGPVLDQVGRATVLEVTGDAEGSWWPVSYDRNGEAFNGWVAESHIEGIPQTGYERLRAAIDNLLP